MGKYLRKPEKRRPNVFLRILMGLLTLVVSAVSIVVTVGVLLSMAQNMGDPGNAAQSSGGSAAIMDKYDMFVTNEISDALDGILSVPKSYWLSDEDLVAPEPDQSKFGSTEDPATLQWLLDDAAELLEGQTTYFSTEAKLMPGTKVNYYLDETILAITWKEIHDYTVYTFSEVKIAHPSQFRRFLAGGEYGSEKQFITTEMAASVNAVVASSGDFYRFRDHGTSVYAGTVHRVNGEYADTCYIDDMGDLHFTYAGKMLDVESAQKYVDENNIRFSLAFGPILVDNGERCEPNWYPVGEIEEEYARAALCQIDKLHYLMVAANNEGQYQNVPNIHTFAKRIHETGCKMAYALDGGQTAAIAMNDQLINRVVYGYQRKISDIIYFATAVPDGG